MDCEYIRLLFRLSKPIYEYVVPSALIILSESAVRLAVEHASTQARRQAVVSLTEYAGTQGGDSLIEHIGVSLGVSVVVLPVEHTGV